MIFIEDEDWELIPIKINATSSVRVEGDIQLEFISENEEQNQLIYFENIHPNEIERIIRLELGNQLSLSVHIELKFKTAKKKDALITFSTKDLTYPYNERTTSVYFENLSLQQTQKIVLFVTVEQEP